MLVRAQNSQEKPNSFDVRLEGQLCQDAPKEDPV